MNRLKEKGLIDLRYKKSKDFINKNIGKPVYKKRAFSFINTILGPQYKWIDKSPEEYFYKEGLSTEEQEVQELQQCARILQFKANSTFSDVKKTYKKLSKEGAFHPDLGGHSSAFSILNHAYNNFKEIYNNSL